MGDQAEDVIPHNNLRQYTDEQWRRQSRSTKTAVFVLGWITNANRAEMILAWMDKKEWGEAKSHKEDGITAHESMRKKMCIVKKTTTEPCKKQTSGAQKVAKGDISFSFADKLAA